MRFFGECGQLRIVRCHKGGVGFADDFTVLHEAKAKTMRKEILQTAAITFNVFAGINLLAQFYVYGANLKAS